MQPLKRHIVTACGVLAAASGLLAGCGRSAATAENRNLVRAKATLDSLYLRYEVEGSCLLRENHPFTADYRAGYLASEDQAQPNPYSFLWPFSGTLSAVSALIGTDASWLELLDRRVLPGLNEYFDTTRMPAAYASYIRTAPPSDRFYDDNVWLGIDFCDLYAATGDRRFLDEAKRIWLFIESGMDDVLGGGIYWCEQKKHSKNTCSNAPGAVYAMKLYAAAGDRRYLAQAEALYAWTKEHLLDPEDGLYFDNIAVDGRIGRAKYAYNSGQMVQAGALLFRATGDEIYLKEAQRTAAACHDRFFEAFDPVDGEPFRILRKGNTWFSAVMVRGLAELYGIDGNAIYLRDVQRTLDYAWEHARSGYGLFETDFSGATTDSEKWLLTQGAMVEMFARMGALTLE